MEAQAVRGILDSVHDGQASQLQQQWQNKSPQQTLQAARSLLYGVCTPAVAEQPGGSDAITEIQAVFESLFQTVEQQSRSRSRSGS